MSSFLSIIQESALTIVAIILGFRALADLNRFCKTVFVQVMIYAVASVVGYLIMYWQSSQGLQQNNQFVWNIHLVFETTLLLLAALYFFTHKWKKNMTIILWLIFLFIWVIQVSLNGILIYSHYTDLAACFIITLISVLVLYEIFLKTEKHWYRQPEVYICIGLLGYYASSIPYIALMGYLQEKQPEMNTYLFRLINGVLASVRYLGVAVAFWLVRKNKLTPAYE